LACNIYITGLNQIQDIEIDSINKPWLPIPAGLLSKKNASLIIVVALMIALISAAWVNVVLFLLILVISALGTAYSLPPIKFKKHHMGAAISILLVRGILVNVGMPLQFLFSITGKLAIPQAIWPLVFFVVGFSLGIAWFKDIPDTKGDNQYNIKTLAIALSPNLAFRYGVAVVSLSYIGLMLIGAFLGIAANEKLFFLSHGLLLLLFLFGAAKVNLDHEKNLKRFYLGFWGFFFMEYILYPIALFH
jgi:homogentisate phytyltransferase/homogentisate geranylgeranyltransferase